MMPFLSEELWRTLPGTEGTVMTAAFPKAADFPDDAAALDEVALLQEAIVAVRRIRSEMEISPRVELTLRMTDPGALGKHGNALRDLARVTSVVAGGREGASATAVIRGQDATIPLEGVIDLDAERSRLDKEIQKSDKDVTGLTKRLNPGFRAKAPPQVIEEFETKLEAAKERLARLSAARALLG
jgi:valyl-tRNA synthetase